MQPERPRFVMSKCCAFWAQVIAGWGLPLGGSLAHVSSLPESCNFFLDDQEYLYP